MFGLSTDLVKLLVLNLEIEHEKVGSFFICFQVE